MSSLNIIQSFPDLEKPQPGNEVMPYPKPTSFAFVTFSDVNGMRNASAKSQIRKHAMKDIGATRRRAHKRRQGCIRIPIEIIPEMLAPHPASNSIDYEGVDPFLQYPVELDRDGRKLVNNMFGSAQRALREDWFTVALTTAPAFIQALANSALQFEIEDVDMPRVHDRSAMQYHQLALSSVRRELALLKGQVTEGVLGAVSAMVCWNTIRSANDEWAVQTHGMIGLIDSYEGGLKAIARNKALRSTLSWVELRGVYMQDLPPRIPLPDEWVAESNAFLCDGWNAQHHGLTLFDDGGEQLSSLSSYVTLLRIYRDLVRFSQIAANDVVTPAVRQESPKFPLWTNVVIHMLLTLRPLNNSTSESTSPACLVAEAFRLAMLLYMAPIWRFYGSHPSNTRTIIGKLHRILDVEMHGVSWCPTFHKLQAWVLFMGAMEAELLEEEQIKHSFVNSLAKLALLEETIQNDIRSVLWVPGLLDQGAAVLQEEISTLRLNPKSTE